MSERVITAFQKRIKLHKGTQDMKVYNSKVFIAKNLYCERDDEWLHFHKVTSHNSTMAQVVDSSNANSGV